jgi:hypothetical protein
MYYGLLGLAGKAAGPSYGTLTTAWIAATGETDLTILGALNTLETDLTTYGLTSKMKALYPFVGGTAAKHKYNFMDARDLDAAFRLTFNGGWTHSSNGALPNGTNAYANTFLSPSTSLSQNSAAIGVYLTGSITIDTGVHIGSANSGFAQGLYLTWSYSAGAGSDFSRNNNDVGTGVSTDNLSKGFIQNYRSNSTNMKVLKHSLAALVNSNATTGLSNSSVYIAALNVNGATNNYTGATKSFAYISDGYTDAEAANLYTAVQAFQTTLSRQV